MDPIITVGGTMASDLLAYAGQLFTDLNSLIVLAIGLPVGFWVINKAIGVVRGRAK
jgi:hypothetical protein